MTTIWSALEVPDAAGVGLRFYAALIFLGALVLLLWVEYVRVRRQLDRYTGKAE